MQPTKLMNSVKGSEFSSSLLVELGDLLRRVSEIELKMEDFVTIMNDFISQVLNVFVYRMMQSVFFASNGHFLQNYTHIHSFFPIIDMRPDR